MLQNDSIVDAPVAYSDADENGISRMLTILERKHSLQTAVEAIPIVNSHLNTACTE